MEVLLKSEHSESEEIFFTILIIFHPHSVANFTVSVPTLILS